MTDPARAEGPAGPAVVGPILVLGGARSGKSRHAEALVLASSLEPVYLATAQAGDAEMIERIALHRARRGPEWTDMSAPLDLGLALCREAAPQRAVLVDCLTLWLSNVMLAGRDLDAEIRALVAATGAAGGPVVMVSNEVGLGLVPDNPLGRRFRDAQGRLNQDIAAISARVDFVAAGIPITLKKPQERA